MDQFANIPPEDIPLNFSAFTWAMIFLGAATMRVLPALMALGAILKLRAFPELRSLHVLLLIELAFIAALALAETFSLVPGSFRVTGIWSFLWVFAIAWAVVTWIRSAIKTGLRPRWIDTATLVCAALLVFSLSAAILPDMLTR
ncbi:hypothetical protein [Gymnodinialimonas hymeniacidonis]|uniref:hypothetical protein n=1 Tax=Gymnodinialimonas hymeniacidonis TaxID=3126508 RepID=UPI0034C6C00D